MRNHLDNARTSLFGAAFLAVTALTALPAVAATSNSTNGTITLRAKSADVGVGWTWGDGVLRWRGHTYPFSVKGVNVAAVGYSSVVAHGNVRNLKSLHDFDGTYAASTGEATAGNGLAGQALVNGNGVRIAINGSTKGARLSGSADGIQMTLK